MIVLEREPLTVEIELRPLRITVRHGHLSVVSGVRIRLLDGVVHDHFVRWTEGVVAHEKIVDRLDADSAEVVAWEAHSVTLVARFGQAHEAAVRVSLPGCDRVRIAAEARSEVLRCAIAWAAGPDERFCGLGARHCAQID